MTTLDELNRFTQPDFVEAVGWVFERSPWVAERAWLRRPFASLDALHTAMIDEVAAATDEEQLELLRAHPDLGTVLGRARTALTPVSAREQTNAGLAALDPDEAGRLSALNAAYREKFGFPFIYAVKGRTPREMLGSLERRLPSARTVEHAEALRQVSRIARFRLEESIS